MRTGKLKYNILRPQAELITTNTGPSITINSSYVSLVADGVQINAIYGGVDGQLLTITNISGGSCTIKAAVSLGPSNNINLVGWGTSTLDCTLNTQQSITLIYDGPNTKWLEVGRHSPAGAIGVQGIPGVQGGIGSNGAQGVQGVEGLQGAQGATGPEGTTGSQGSQGTQGLNGDAGTAGTTGAPGVAGAAGSQGNQGDPGAQGDQGIQGTQGSQGAQGI
jgi:hypothetical protein